MREEVLLEVVVACNYLAGCYDHRVGEGAALSGEYGGSRGPIAGCCVGYRGT